MRIKVLFGFVLLISFSLNLVGRVYNLYLYFIISGILNVLLTYYSLKINPLRKVGLFLIFTPLLLAFFAVIYGIIVQERMPGLSGFILHLMATICALLLTKKLNKKKIILTYAIIYIICVFNFYNFENYYSSQFNKNKNVSMRFPVLQLIDKNLIKNQIQSNGKIIIIDLWSLSCGSCIEAFPKFEKLKNEFKNDREIKFLAINIYMDLAEIRKSEKYLKNYTFKNLYADKSLFKTFNFNSIPNYMIVGKDGRIKYFGSLNTGTFETYNNIYTLIDNEK